MWLSLLIACAPQAPPGDDTDADPCGGATPELPVALEAVIDGEADACELQLYLDILDDRGQREGPWFEDLFVVHSADARTFDVEAATPIRTRAAVPELVRGDDGRYYLFHGEGDLDLGREVARSGSDWFATHGLVGYGALNLMVSDDGFTYTPVEDFAIEGMVRGMAVDPDVIRLPDGRWRMYYVGVPVPELIEDDAWQDGAEHTVFYAESENLVRWRQIGVAAEGPNADPSVFCFLDGRCLMTSTGVDWSTSTDGGQTFSWAPSEDPFGFAPEFLLLPDAGLRLFYNSREAGGALRSLFSVDGGATWVDEGERIPARLVEAVSLAPAPDHGWIVAFHYWQEPYSGDYWGQDDTDG